MCILYIHWSSLIWPRLATLFLRNAGPRPAFVVRVHARLYMESVPVLRNTAEPLAMQNGGSEVVWSAGD